MTEDENVPVRVARCITFEEPSGRSANVPSNEIAGIPNDETLSVVTLYVEVST